MKALILNSGVGSRMGILTEHQHKSMVSIQDGLPLIAYQLNTLYQAGILDIVITTGYMEDKLVDFVTNNYSDKLNITFVNNPSFKNTNYIYSIYLSLDKLQDDIILMHGDLYFDKSALSAILDSEQSCIVIDSKLPLPEKDFKAEVRGQYVKKVATYIKNEDCIACQPLYKLIKKDWMIWAEAIRMFCAEGNTNVYAEEALNTVLDNIELKAFDLNGTLCMEVDTPEDLALLKSKI